jgi:hypothetical protein
VIRDDGVSLTIALELLLDMDLTLRGPRDLLNFLYYVAFDQYGHSYKEMFERNIRITGRLENAFYVKDRGGVFIPIYP